MRAGTHRPDISALVCTLLGTIVTVLVAWTKFWYEVGSLSLGTELVATRGQSIVRRDFTTKEGFRGSDPACVFFLMVIISIILRVHIVTIAAVIWRSGRLR